MLVSTITYLCFEPKWYLWNHILIQKYLISDFVKWTPRRSIQGNLQLRKLWRTNTWRFPGKWLLSLYCYFISCLIDILFSETCFRFWYDKCYVLFFVPMLNLFWPRGRWTWPSSAYRILLWHWVYARDSRPAGYLRDSGDPPSAAVAADRESIRGCVFVSFEGPFPYRNHNLFDKLSLSFDRSFKFY